MSTPSENIQGIPVSDTTVDALDRRIILATQAGLPRVEEPYDLLAAQLDIGVDQLLERVRILQDLGVVRRIAAVPNHYALGYRANGMSVWNVPDAVIGEYGRKIGALEFVSHCYHRPRHLPLWPYNLFAMAHGRTRQEVEDKVAAIADLLGDDNRGHEVLYSSRILKKTGLRIPR